jgi:hypothetical protein
VRSISALGKLVVVAAAAACAHGAASTDERLERPTRRQRDVISKEELSAPAVRSQSVYEVVRTLRPHFLNDRGSHGIPYSGSGGTDADKVREAVNPAAGRVHVSIDNGTLVSLDELKSLHANGVVEIRYLSAAAAMQKFGTKAMEGPVILVLTM